MKGSDMKGAHEVSSEILATSQPRTIVKSNFELLARLWMELGNQAYKCKKDF